jgi:hypothetical protein
MLDDAFKLLKKCLWYSAILVIGAAIGMTGLHNDLFSIIHGITYFWTGHATVKVPTIKTG